MFLFHTIATCRSAGVYIDPSELQIKTEKRYVHFLNVKCLLNAKIRTLNDECTHFILFFIALDVTRHATSAGTCPMRHRCS